MEPLLAWVVCGLSVFLLTAGGFLLARAMITPRLLHHVHRQRVGEAALVEALTAREIALAEAQAAREALARAGDHGLPSHAEGHPPRWDASGSGEGFDEPTHLPDPVALFHLDRSPVMAPSLQRISDKEYEITAAASQDDSEALADGMGGRDETRQFNLHSSEAVVHFLQRIDELSDENRDLRAALADRDQMLKTKQQEGSDTVQRSALLQSAVDKLRQELGRRNARIKQLQSQIAGELTAASSAASLPTGGDGQGPGSSGDTTSVVLRSPSDQEQIVDMPTLEVHRLDEGDLR